MPFKSMKVLGLLTVLLTALLMVDADASAQKTESAEQPAAKEKKEEPPPGLAELVSMASELNERLSRLQRQIGTVFDLTAARKWYDAITVKLDKLTERVQTQKSIEKPTYQDLAELKAVIRQKDGADSSCRKCQDGALWPKDRLRPASHLRFRFYPSSMAPCRPSGSCCSG